MNSSNQKNKICAVIPFYNEEKFIYKVIKDTIQYVDQVFAVDDGSTDNSALIISKLARVKIIKLQNNYGKGYALQKGFDNAINQNFDIVITLDADGQHEPQFIPDFLRCLENFDLCIGNRLNETNQMPLQRIASNKITSFLLSVKLNQKIFDSQCGFRAFKIYVLKNIRTNESGYEAESELLIKAAKKGYKIGSVDISTIYGSEKSKIKPVKAITGFIKILFK